MRPIEARSKQYNVTIQWLAKGYSRGTCELCTLASEKILVVDHNHACCPGVRSCGLCVRGMICYSCNIRLGRLEASKRLNPPSGWTVMASKYLGRDVGAEIRPRPEKPIRKRDEGLLPRRPKHRKEPESPRGRVRLDARDSAYLLYGFSDGTLVFWPRPDWGNVPAPLGAIECNLIDCVQSAESGLTPVGKWMEPYAEYVEKRDGGTLCLCPK